MRRLWTCLLAVVVGLQTSCAVVPPEPLAQPDKKSLGRVAVVGARFDPGYRFEALTAGKGEGAVKGAAAAPLYCGELMKGSGGSGIVVLLFLACLPVAATLGAVHGASQAASAQRVEGAKADAQRAIAALGLQNDAVEAASRYGRELGLDIGQLPASLGPADPAQLPSYAAARNAADSVIEISVLDAHAVTTGERGLYVALGMRARVRVIGARDGKVIDALTLTYRGAARTMEEWLRADGEAIKAEFHRGSAFIAEQAIDEILLVYSPRAVSQQTADTTERVPPYALRAIEPPVRTKVPLRDLQPSFRWEAWPRGFDIVPGNAPGQAQRVRYELRVFHRRAVVYERRDLVPAEHRLERALEPCTTYQWTVRARFDLNGAPRATEWMGAYDTLGGSYAPWWWRRESSVPALAAIPPSVVALYPIVETPSMDGQTCPGR